MKQTAAVIASTPYLTGFPLSGATRDSTTAVRAWSTTDDHKFSPIDAPIWRESSDISQATIEIDSTLSYQSILGFGGYLQTSPATFSQVDAIERCRLLADLVGPDGLRMSVGQTCIGSSDYLRAAYSFDDSLEPDPELTRFSIAHDRDILPVLRAAQEVNPDISSSLSSGGRRDG